MHKTSAWPLSLVYLALIVYASLYPFADWRDQGLSSWAFLSASLPKYWTWFDVVSNVLGYLPLGFLLTLSALRSGRTRFAPLTATMVAALLSLSMEALQSYLPSRVASNLDLALNVLGALGGAMLAWSLERMGVLDRWSRFRARWFESQARDALVLLALWPMALLFPAAVPFGLGQVMERFEAALAEALQDTPFLNWLPVRDIELQPLLPATEMICVALGLLIPCLLGFGVIRYPFRRAFFLLMVFATGLGACLLSATLSYGPEHAWAWLSLPVKAGMFVAFGLVLMMLWLPRPACATFLLLALGIYLSLINLAPTSPYFAQTLATWEQGRFIRFNGLAQWLGWLWPYATLGYVLTRLWGREPKN